MAGRKVTVEQFWQQVLVLIKDQIKENSFEQWFRSDTIRKVVRQGGNIYICVSDVYAKTAIEHLYLELLEQAKIL